MDLKELEKMTVVKLREEAAKYEDVKGAIGMSKEQLIDLLCGKLGIDRTVHIPKGIGRHALKEKILKLKAQTTSLQAAGDRKKVHHHRRRLHALRRRLRHVVALAARGKVAEAKKEAGAEG